MKVPSLSPEFERELEMLRRRAYGPDADIVADSDAAGRLERLERAARAVSTTARRTGVFPSEPNPGIDGHASDAPNATLQPTDAGPHGAVAAQGPASAHRAPAPWWRRRPMWLAVATVAASAAVAMTITVIAAGPRPDVSLPMTGETPTDALTGNLLWLVSTYDIEPDSILGHNEFAAMSVWTARTEGGMRCLFLTAGDAFELASSCMPAGLDPTIDFTVYPGMSDVVGGDFPDHTALRFVSRGDGVDVWVRPPPTP